MRSKSKIEKKLQKKTNSILVETIIAAKKKKEWNPVADILSSPRRKRINLNLEDIEKKTKDGEHVVIPGKVLSQGELNKKIKITAMNFSEKAREKLLKSKIEVSNMLDEIKKNPSAKGIKILTNKER